MSWSLIVTVICIATSGYCINRPVYKIVLTQKGFSQFIQYDLETPAIREFTFCTWVRLYDLDSEQGLFSYVVNGNRVIRLWLDSGGHFIKVAIKEKSPSMVTVDIARDTWRHICMSYQSDFGAWALYVDGRLLHCETSQNLYDFVLPSGGSVIIGYGSNNVIPSGLEGELFGANMILSSTIERNHTLKKDPFYEQKRFVQNKVIGNRHLKYIVLGALDSMSIINNYETSAKPIVTKKMKYFKKISYPFSHSEHIISSELTSARHKLLYVTNGQTNLDFSKNDFTGTTDKLKISFWSLVNTERSKLMSQNIKKLNNTNGVGQSTKKSTQTVISQSSPSTMTTLTNKYIIKKSVKHITAKDKLFDFSTNLGYDKITFEKNQQHSQSETDIILRSTSNNEYNKWKSSNSGNNVLNYLKSINLNNQEPLKMKINKPFIKSSNNLKKSKDFKGTKVPSPLQLFKQNFDDKYYEKREVVKTACKNNSIDNNSLKKRRTSMTKQTKVVNKNSTVKYKTKKLKRQINEQDLINYKIILENNLANPINSLIGKLKDYPIGLEGTKKNNTLTILPFIKSVDYFSDEANNSSDEILNADSKTSDIFARSLLQGNKWHNVQTFNNDYTPHRVNMDPGRLLKNTDISEANKNLPSVRIKYIHNARKLLVTPKEANIIEGQALAKTVSNQSSKNNTFSILKYNRGFLSNSKASGTEFNKGNPPKKSSRQNLPSTRGVRNNDMKYLDTLSKHPIINKEDDNILNLEMGHPQYTYDNDKPNKKTVTHVGTKVCTKFEISDHFLYVQSDGSVDITSIVSPVKERNIGIEFIMQNYKRCSLQDSYLEKNNLLYLNWNKTPVRLFGGAYPKKTTDLCGFF